MAEGFPSYILDTVLNQLESPLFQSSNKLNFRLHTQLRDLRSKLELIREVIHEAEWMGVLFPEFVGYWVCDLQCVLHEVDDLLDEALTRSMPASDMVEKVLLHLANMPFGLTLAHKMKKLNKRLEKIVDKCYDCNLFVVESSQSQPRKPVARRGILRYDPDYVKDEEFQMIGRDEEKRRVIEMLIGPCKGDPYVFVRGKPGVGKTTLCRAVFNDVQVKNWFDIRLWFNFFDGSKGWCKKIQSELGADEEEAQPHRETEDNPLDSISSSRVENKRILIVFDNLWEDVLDGADVGDSSRFRHMLRQMLSISQRWSKVLLPSDERLKTSRKILTAVGGFNGYYLKNDLSEDDSRSIFNKAGPVVLGDGGHDLGEQIVSKCMGNPVLLKGIGTLLYGNSDRTIWEHFAHNFDFSGRYDHYAAISRLNISHPKCHWNVGYLSLFTKGEFQKKSLFHQFTAHGFTNLSSAQVQDSFNNFVIFSSKDNWDVEDNFTVSGDKENVILQMSGRESTTARCAEAVIHKETRHVSIVRPSSPAVQQTHEIMLPHSLIKDITHRRTLLLLGELPIKMSVQTLNTLSSSLHYLRVLDLHDLALQTLPSSIGNLIHLRYLDLSRNDFKILPDSICKLKVLQTLKLFYCDKLLKLPRRIDILGHLKNLEINMCLDLTLMPSTIGRLAHLEKLDRFVVNPHKGGLKYLEYLDNLNGDLDIELPRRWKASTVESEKAKLERKKKLTKLRFKWPGVDNGGDTDDGEDNDDVLDKLKPWDSIKCLSIVNFGGTKFPSWIMDISCLSEIVISKCKRCEVLPLFHGIPNLRLLTLTSIMNIEYLQDNICSSDLSVFFPSLKELKIGEMPNLKGWSRDLSGLPKFQDIDSLSIWSCPHLTTLPSLSGNGITLQAVSKEIVQLIDWRRCSICSLISIPDMVVFPDRFVNKLPEHLTIKDCNQLQMLWTNGVQVGELPNLKNRTLSISNAPALKHMRSSLQQLSYLIKLEISGCDEELDCLYDDEDRMPWEALKVLYDLDIKGFQILVSLPNGLRRLPRLAALNIENCKALKWEAGSLPPSLRRLRIKSCPVFSERCEDIEREHPHLRFVEQWE